jgi:hypothetical protein
MPGCGVAGLLLVFLGSGFLVIMITPGMDVRDPTSRTSSGSAASAQRDIACPTAGNHELVHSGQRRLPREARNRLRHHQRRAIVRIARQLIDKENFEHI